MELSSLLGKGKPEQALRSIKRYAIGYLNLPFDSAPYCDFWRFSCRSAPTWTPFRQGQ